MGLRHWTMASAGGLLLAGGATLAAFPVEGSASTAEGSHAAAENAPDLDDRAASFRPETHAAVPSIGAVPTMDMPSSIAGVPDALLHRALAALETHRGDLANTTTIGIADYAAHSSMPRFFIVDLEQRTARAVRVTHGSGSDRDHDGYLDRFSDEDGSNATSRGAYRTAEVYDGKYGQAERLDGLDPSNRTARSRAIVMHHAWYAEPDVVAKQKRLGRSQGCFAFASADLPAVMKALPPGSMIYADKI